MTTFVGAEYVIASMLIGMKKKGIDIISLSELSNYGICVQTLSNEKDVDAVFLTSKPQIFNAIFDFSDYFECEYDEEDKIQGIRIESSKTIEELEKRFVGFLPQRIFELLCIAVDSVVA